MNEYQLATARLLLRRLEARPDQAHDVSRLRLLSDEDLIQRIAAREAEYRAFNRDMKGGSSMLSADALTYWSDFKKMLRAGRLHHALGGTGKREKTVSLMCERLEESFVHRVPNQEQGMFQVYDPQRMDAGNWDDRWHACVDYFPPILRAEFADGASIDNPKAQAQIDVLTELLTPASPPPTAEQANSAARLRALAGDR